MMMMMTRPVVIDANDETFVFTNTGVGVGVLRDANGADRSSDFLG